MGLVYSPLPTLGGNSSGSYSKGGTLTVQEPSNYAGYKGNPRFLGLSEIVLGNSEALLISRRISTSSESF